MFYSCIMFPNLSFLFLFLCLECQESSRLSPFPVMKKACENGFNGGFNYGLDVSKASFGIKEEQEQQVQEPEQQQQEEEQQQEQQQEQEQEPEPEQVEEESQYQGESVRFQFVDSKGSWKEGFVFVRDGEEVKEAVRRHCASNNEDMDRADCEKLIQMALSGEEEEIEEEKEEGNHDI